MKQALDRYLNILQYTIAALLRRRGKNFSLLVIFTFLIFVLASVMFFTTALKREAALLLEGAPDLVVQKMMAGRHDPIPLTYTTKIEGIRGVTEVRPRLWGYYYEPVARANYTIMVPLADPPPAGEVSIGRGVARSLHLAVGDLVMLHDYQGGIVPFEVRSLFAADSELVSSDLLLMAEPDFRALFNVPAAVAIDLAVSVSNPRELPTVAAKITAALPDTRVIVRDDMLRTYAAIFDWRAGMMIVILFAAILSFVIFAWDKATGLSAEERKEIGILRAVGWDTADIILLKVWEGAVIALTSFLLGVILAYGHVFFLGTTIFEQALKGWSTLYPRFRLTPFIGGGQLVVLFMLTVAPYLAATVVPAWRAATTDPESVMRN